MKIIIKKEIRQLDENTYWIGVRDIYIKRAIENKEMLEIELAGNGMAVVDPKMIKRNYKTEPFVGLYPENPMQFYYFPIELLSQEKQEKLENRDLIYALG